MLILETTMTSIWQQKSVFKHNSHLSQYIKMMCTKIEIWWKKCLLLQVHLGASFFLVFDFFFNCECMPVKNIMTTTNILWHSDLISSQMPEVLPTAFVPLVQMSTQWKRQRTYQYYCKNNFILADSLKISRQSPGFLGPHCETHWAGQFIC